jgi:hypothetical protein
VVSRSRPLGKDGPDEDPDAAHGLPWSQALAEEHSRERHAG